MWFSRLPPWGDFEGFSPPSGLLARGIEDFGALELWAMSSQRPPPVSFSFDSSKLFWNSSCCSRFVTAWQQRNGGRRLMAIAGHVVVTLVVTLDVVTVH